MAKSKIFLSLLSGFIFGVFIRSFFEIGQSFFFLSLIFSLIILFAFYKNKIATMVAFLLVFFVSGLWLTDSRIKAANNLIYLGKNFQEQAVVEKVTDSAFGQTLIVNFQNEKIYVLVQAPQYPAYSYGDLLEMNCTLGAIENRDDDFDYRMYMAKEGVSYRCDKAKVKKIGEDSGNWLYGRIIKARTIFESKINAVIPQPEGALAIGLLLGGSGGLSKEIQTDFSRTGMTHIVAVSGYNVTIIAEYLILLGIALGLWRKQAIWFAIVGIALFVIMSGLPASAVRAGVMSGVLLWAMKHGRLATCENAIVFAAAIMLFLNPLLLRWDVGFQLSFLATLGIVLTSSFWEENFVKENEALGISESVTLSFSAQLFVLPVIAYNFHIASLVSLLANIFILPVIPLSMLLVFLVTLAGLVWSPLSLVFGWSAFLLLAYVIRLIHVLSEFPWASVNVCNIKPWHIFLYYIVLILGLFQLKRMESLKIKMENSLK